MSIRIVNLCANLIKEPKSKNLTEERIKTSSNTYNEAFFEKLSRLLVIN